MYGIKIFPDDFLAITHYADGVSRMMTPPRPDYDEPSAQIISAEENADIHAFMKLRALKEQISRLAEEDPEFAALLVGDEPAATANKSGDHQAKKEYIDEALVEISRL